MSRPLFTLSCLLLALLSGCSKSHSSKPDLMGQWRLMKSIGTGIVSTGIQDYSQEMRTLQLLPDSSYKRSIQGGFTEFGSYSIYTRSAVNGMDTIITFRSSGGNESGAILYLHGQEMYLHLAGVTEDYVRKTPF